MADILYSIDVAVFHFVNGAIANPFFDILMPFLTDLNRTLYGKIIACILWLLLIWKGGKRGRLVAILLIPLIVLSDQLSSSVIKKIFTRPRPCHTLSDVTIVTGIRLLVDCGSGFSFPSSHAVNNFAAASLFSIFYKKWTLAFIAFASLVGISRIYVGVHYPSDIVGGAMIGVLCAIIILGIWKMLGIRFPALEIDEDKGITKE